MRRSKLTEFAIVASTILAHAGASADQPQIFEYVKDGIEVSAQPSLPVEGGEFGSNSRHFGFTSKIIEDGGKFKIQIDIGTTYPGKIYAPVALALTQAANAENLSRLIEEYKTTALPLNSEGEYQTQISLPGDGKNVYVVVQPITFSDSTGTICVPGLVYSPIKVPKNLQGCDGP